MHELRVGHPLAGGLRRNLHRHEQIVLAERGGHHALEERWRVDGAAAGWTGDDESGAERREHRRQIGRGVGVRHVAANRAAVTDGRVADLGRRVRERRAVLAERRRRSEIGVRRERADAHEPALHRDPLELGDAADVDDGRWRRQPELEQWDEAMTSGQQLRAGMLLEERAGFRNRARAVVVEICGEHGRRPS